MLLTVAIPTTYDRQELFENLISKLSELTDGMDDIEILYSVDNYELPIGAKRNQLLNNATGKYFVMIDSDDDISDDYFLFLLPELAKEPDCVGYYEEVRSNGTSKLVKHSISCGKWTDTPLQRTPFYKTPILTVLAKAVGFDNVRYGEDHIFAKAIYPLLKKEIFIEAPMYIYNQPAPMNKAQHRLRYGIK